MMRECTFFPALMVGLWGFDFFSLAWVLLGVLALARLVWLHLPRDSLLAMLVFSVDNYRCICAFLDIFRGYC